MKEGGKETFSTKKNLSGKKQVLKKLSRSAIFFMSTLSVMISGVTKMQLWCAEC